MKLIHLSDLHIGKRVNGFSMLEDQKYILQQILMVIRREWADGVILAGDIYDKPVPSAEAVQVFDGFLTELAKMGQQVFVISGNHDSAERLAFGEKLMSGRGIHFSPVYDGETKRIVLKDEYGEVVIHLLPFVKPAVVRHALEQKMQESAGMMCSTETKRCAEENDSAEKNDRAETNDRAEKNGSTRAKNSVTKMSDAGQEEILLQESTDVQPELSIQTYQDAVREALLRMTVDPAKRNVLVAHQFVTGAQRCESEEIAVGGLDQVDASLFDAFDYVALGHIHSPQRVGRETVRYCGTPLKYSFSEAGQQKTVTVVELLEKDHIEVRTVPLNPLRDMRMIRGTYMEVTARSFYEGTNTEDYLQVTLTDEEDIPDGMQKLRVIYPNLMRLEYDNRRTRESRTVDGAEAVEEKSELELFGEFYELQNNQPMSEAQEMFVQRMIGKLKGQ